MRTVPRAKPGVSPTTVTATQRVKRDERKTNGAARSTTNWRKRGYGKNTSCASVWNHQNETEVEEPPVTAKVLNLVKQDEAFVTNAKKGTEK